MSSTSSFLSPGRHSTELKENGSGNEGLTRFTTVVSSGYTQVSGYESQSTVSQCDDRLDPDWVACTSNQRWGRGDLFVCSLYLR